MGTLQATEVLKLLLGKGKSLSGRLLVYDAIKLSFRELKLRRDENCALCGDQPTITELQDYEAFCAVPLATAEEEKELLPDEITPQELKAWMDGEQPCSLVDVRETQEWEICRIDSAQLLPLSTFKTAADALNPMTASCCTATRASAPCKRWKNSGKQVLPNCTAWRAALTAGQSKWTRKCRVTD